MDDDFSDEEPVARRMCVELKRAGIKLICADFDLTLIRVHTGGVWQRTAEALSRSVRPCVRALLQEALEAGLHVAVVTFSPQAKLIREVLALAFPSAFATQIVVRALDRSWRYDGEGTADGKLPHIASAVEELTRSRGDAIAKKHVLLVDDDPDNVRTALRHGVNAVICRPAHSADSIARGITAITNAN